MQLYYLDYVVLVLERCDRMRKDAASSPLLISATPANLKQECINVYNERRESSEKEYKNTLKSFFGTLPDGKEFSYLIKNCPLDKFKPVQRLIKGEIKNPDIIYVELLAWLIDFPRRPFVNGMQVALREEERLLLSKPINESKPKQTLFREGDDPSGRETSEAVLDSKMNDVNPSFTIGAMKPSGKKQRVAVMILVVALFLAGYLVWQEQNFRQLALFSANRGCMSWTGDRYEEIPCDEARIDRLKLPLDVQRMMRFKRITREDTITERSIGAVYYIKINGSIEYYTAGGNHPINVTRMLHPLSAYMFDKYLRKKDITRREL